MNEEYLDLADLSDKEDAEQLDLTPLLVNWLDLRTVHCENKLGICSLPGCKYKNNWRSLSFDIKCLRDMCVEHIFCLCTKGELHLYRVHNLIQKYTDAGITVHHYPIEDGQIPPIETLVIILEDIKTCLLNDKTTLIHCFGGLGRSCLVAMCLLMFLDGNTSIEGARQKITEVRGGKAIGSVKQYNYVNDFREILETYMTTRSKAKDDRCASR